MGLLQRRFKTNKGKPLLLTSKVYYSYPALVKTLPDGRQQGIVLNYGKREKESKEEMSLNLPKKKNISKPTPWKLTLGTRIAELELGRHARRQIFLFFSQAPVRAGMRRVPLSLVKAQLSVNENSFCLLAGSSMVGQLESQFLLFDRREIKV